jgi:hypothetical protein
MTIVSLQECHLLEVLTILEMLTFPRSFPIGSLLSSLERLQAAEHFCSLKQALKT